MSSRTIQAMPFIQIIAFKSYLDNLKKTLKLLLDYLSHTLTCVFRNLKFVENTA